MLALWGNAMAGPFEGQAQWREKFHMDDNAVQRLGRSVMRAGLSLPFVLIYAFAPKPDPESMIAASSRSACCGRYPRPRAAEDLGRARGRQRGDGAREELPASTPPKAGFPSRR